ncbi:MAG: tyrosine recombinase [Chloroflexota bacterium]|nr:tyrosine recombinase [Chloroflexota bacterium]
MTRHLSLVTHLGLCYNTATSMEEQIHEFLAHLQESQRYARNTVEAYRNDLNQFLNFATSERPHLTHWSRVDKPLLLGFVMHLKERGYTPSSVARKVAVLKTFYHFLTERNIVAEDPTATLGSPKVQKRLPQILTPDEVDRLLAAPVAHSTPKGFRDRAILELLYATGVRVTELVSLDVETVDLEHATLHCKGQGARLRVLPISSRAAEALSDYLRRGRSALTSDDGERAMFVNPHGERLTRQGLWLIIKGYVGEAGITTPVTPHTLRHSFAVHLLNHGENLENLQRLLGHANITTTQTYARLATVPVAAAAAEPKLDLA